jgi:hypothetical protein
MVWPNMIQKIDKTLIPFKHDKFSLVFVDISFLIFFVKENAAIIFLYNELPINSDE